MLNKEEIKEIIPQREPFLMIDEVDSASNNKVFVEFLALLRKYYLNRDETPIFHSVILAGVYDIKNIKDIHKKCGTEPINKLEFISSYKKIFYYPNLYIFWYNKIKR